MKIRNLLAVMALMLVLSIAACAPDKGARVVKYCDKGTDTVTQLRDGALISQDEAEKILPLIAEVRAGGVEYDAIEREVAVTKEEQLSRRQRLIAVGRKIIASVERLNQEGVLHIKNEKVRNDLTRALAIAQIAANFAD